MKSLKKLISIFLVLLLVVAVFPLGEKSISYADEKVFSDIDNHYAKQTILNWVDKGLIKGYDDGTFKPNKNITRAEFVHIISDYLNLTEKSEVSFKDVPNDAWYFDDLSKVVNKKLINGYEDNTFRANKNITRQEACVIVAKMSDNLTKVKDVHFTDENSFPSWAKENIIKLAQAGIISGYSDTTFKAKNNITRAEIVIVLDKIESQKQKIKEYKKEDKPKEENKQDKKGKLSSRGGGGGSYQSNSNNIEEEKQPNPASDFEFDKSTGTITKYIGIRRNVVIPKMIDGVEVKAIGGFTTYGEGAFQEQNIRTVVIPDSVTIILQNAFFKNNLTSLEIPNSLKYIERNAFASNKLTSLEIPESLEYIGAMAFYNNKITSLEIPETLEDFGFEAFSHNEITSLKLSKSISSIAYGAFEYNKLEYLTIPDTITSIGMWTFKHNKLISVEIGAHTIVENDAFDDGVTIIRR
ncbi:MAG: S-layer homology domain-containing protein [Peptoanaerobacter stomatis]|uniref:S-layer homology domain-containing protein n=1 Tax=Peptoanaerobacter stomatis TaxID=796937 RepID=UPI003FA0239D